MPDFSKGKIYKLVSNKSSDVYIGSCLVELSKRLYSHKSKSNKAVSKSMFDDDAIISIALIEDCPCDNKNQLKARELHYITTLQCININKPFITDVNYSDKKEWQKQYQLEHKEQIKQYYIDHKEQIKQHSKQYKIDNAEQIKQQKKQYNIDNAEQIKQQKKQYQLEHAEHIKQYLKQYYLNKKAQQQITNI